LLLLGVAFRLRAQRHPALVVARLYGVAADYARDLIHDAAEFGPRFVGCLLPQASQLPAELGVFSLGPGQFVG
jgi:hypothetical protein